MLLYRYYVLNAEKVARVVFFTEEKKNRDDKSATDPTAYTGYKLLRRYDK